ncbi:MAG: PQQ-dependent sugar dehydrogenase, partial [Bacteroidota bacterium]
MKFPKFILNVFILFISIPLAAQITYESAFPNITFTWPVEIQNANDGTDRLFVVEQAGRIQVFPRNPNVISGQVSTFLDITDRVLFGTGQEIGLLGLAFHPNYAQNGYFYVFYTTEGPAPNFRPRMRISRFTVTSNSNNADENSELVLFQFDKNQDESNHNGGKIAFGADGYLYLSVGDGGGANDPMNNSQNINNAFGSLCRIDVDLDNSNPISSNGNYEIPNDNPFVGIAGLDEIYAYGIRNTWKFSIDLETDRIWGADVGQDEFEEINLIENGKNYGWKRFEGNTIANPGTSISGSIEAPIFTYDRSQGDVSITGGYVYRGNDITSLNPNIGSQYIFGDFVSGRIWSLDYNPTTGTASQNFLFQATGLFISSFGLDESGELYFSDYASNAQLYKIVNGTSGPAGTAVNGIGQWSTLTNNDINGEVMAVETATDGTVYFGGNFNVSQVASINNLASWTEATGLTNFGSANGIVNALRLDANGNLYVGGSFSQIGAVSANNIAMWNGTSWSALSSGIDGVVAAIEIDPSTGEVYVGGSFSTVNGTTTVRNIAMWNGTSWSGITDAGSGISGTNNEIRSLSFDSEGILYAGGNFDEAGGSPASRIATWNGTIWGTLGSGTSGFVEAIATHNNDIFIGGNFGAAGGQTVNRVARWNKSSNTWSTLNDGLSNAVKSLIHDGENLYAAGNFSLANNSNTNSIIVNKIAQWNAIDGWRPLGTNTNVGVDIKVNTMRFAKDPDGINKIFAGGNFNSAGSSSSQDIAQWLNSGSLSVEEISSVSRIRLFPNPTSNQINLSKPAEWNLFDGLGNILKSGNGTVVHLSSLPNGLYLLKLNKSESFKIIK